MKTQEQIDAFQWNENKHDGMGNKHGDLNAVCDLARIGLAALDAEPVAWIEHHKGGDNLNWERVDHEYAKATPLIAAPKEVD